MIKNYVKLKGEDIVLLWYMYNINTHKTNFVSNFNDMFVLLRDVNIIVFDVGNYGKVIYRMRSLETYCYFNYFIYCFEVLNTYVSIS